MAGANNILGRLKQFDAYPKTLEDFRVKTFGGATSKSCLYHIYLNDVGCATVTLLSAAIIAILFLSELVYFLSTDVRAFQPEDLYTIFLFPLNRSGKNCLWTLPVLKR